MDKSSIITLLILGLIFSSCTKSNNDSSRIVDSNLDERPGYKSIKLRKTIAELEPHIKEISDDSELLLNDSSAIDENFAKRIKFKLDNEIRKVGQFEVKKIYGTTYRDTLYGVSLYIEGYKNLKGFTQILKKIYGEGTKEESYNYDEIVWEDHKTILNYVRGKDLGYISFDDREFLKRLKKTKKIKVDQKTVEEF